MDPWAIWLIIAGIGFVVLIIGLIGWFVADYDIDWIFGLVAIIGLVVFIGAGITGAVLGSQQSQREANQAASEQGLTIVGSASKQSYYLVTVDGVCTISADQIDGKFVVVGSDPVIELTPGLVAVICAGGLPR